MSDLALLVRLQARVTAFLAEQTPATLLALAEGRMSLTVTDGASAVVAPPQSVTPPGPQAAQNPSPQDPVAQNPVAQGSVAQGPVGRKPTAPKSSADPDKIKEIVERLRACATFEDGAALLATVKLSAADTRLLAKAVEVPPERRMADTTKKVLNLLFSSRSKHAALLQG